MPLPSKGLSQVSDLGNPTSLEDATIGVQEASAIIRPRKITIIAWMSIVTGIAFLILKPFTWEEFTLERNLWNCLTKATSVACGFGLLGMRRWAVVTYFVLFAINTVLIYVWPPNKQTIEMYSEPQTIAMLFLVPAIVGAIVLPHWKDMR